MTDIKKQESKVESKVEPTKKQVIVTAEGGVTFGREFFAKGDKIPCTADQEKILKAQGVI